MKTPIQMESSSTYHDRMQLEKQIRFAYENDIEITVSLAGLNPKHSSNIGELLKRRKAYAVSYFEDQLGLDAKEIIIGHFVSINELIKQILAL